MSLTPARSGLPCLRKKLPVTKPDGQTAHDTARSDGPPRFSLFTLLTIVTLCAGVFGLTRVVGNIVLVWLAAAGTAGVTVGLVFGLLRRRIKRSVLGACVGATLATGFPLASLVLFHLAIAREPLWIVTDEQGLVVVIGITLLGALGGLVGGAVGALSDERHSPEEVGVLWGAGTGCGVVLVPAVIAVVAAVFAGEVEIDELCLGILIFLIWICLGAMIGSAAGVAIAGLVRVFLGEQRSSMARRKYSFKPPRELKDD
jgi:hypothetical protein